MTEIESQSHTQAHTQTMGKNISVFFIQILKKENERDRIARLKQNNDSLFNGGSGNRRPPWAAICRSKKRL